MDIVKVIIRNIWFDRWGKENIMSKSKKNKKEIIGSIFFILIMLVGGFLVGFLSAKLSNEINISVKDNIIYFVIFAVIYIVQIIFHEAGHLIFGLISGYEFIFFRIGSITIVKDNGKFKFKRFNIKGTGGQCIMMPKTDNYREVKYVLYNLGGVLMNTIVSSIGLIILLNIDTNRYINVMLIAVIVMGVVCIISNGIPMKIGGIANDGYNILSISRDDFTKYCFYTQLKINGLLYKGVRIKDMPLEWFSIKDGADINNPIVTSLRIMEANYYQDRLEFDIAKKCYENILESTPRIIKLYENEIKCELLFLEILNGNLEKVQQLYNKELSNYIKATNCYISRKRLMYAYNLMVTRDNKKSKKILKEFEKTKNTYPVKAEIESEIEIINLLNSRFKVA